jgi:hypothetical protein
MDCVLQRDGCCKINQLQLADSEMTVMNLDGVGGQGRDTFSTLECVMTGRMGSNTDGQIATDVTQVHVTMRTVKNEKSLTSLQRVIVRKKLTLATSVDPEGPVIYKIHSITI